MPKENEHAQDTTVAEEVVETEEEGVAEEVVEVKEGVASEEGMTYEAALDQIAKDNPELVKQYARQLGFVKDEEDAPETSEDDLDFEDRAALRVTRRMSAIDSMLADARAKEPDAPAELWEEAKRQLQSSNYTADQMEKIRKSGAFIRQIGGAMRELERSGKVKPKAKSAPAVAPINQQTKEGSSVTAEQRVRIEKIASQIGADPKQYEADYLRHMKVEKK